MKAFKKLVLSLLIFTIPLWASGCWNYREIDKLAIVAGVAIDKEGDNFILTVEILKITGGRETKITSQLITMEGKTIFDAARNQILLSGKRLYWSHTKVIIISNQLAREGIVKAVDWYNRDSDTRPDIHIVVSKGETAREILTGQNITEEVKSFELDDMLESQKSLGKTPETELWEFINNMKSKGISAVTPLVELRKTDSKMVTSVAGTAIFTRDKLVGYLNEDETKFFLFVKNRIKSGVLPVKKTDSGTLTSLEVFKNKTRIQPIINKDSITMNVNIETTVAIDEIEGTENLIENEVNKDLEKAAEKYIQTQVTELIKKVQSDIDSDIFGFGEKLRNTHNREWKKYENNWGETFKTLNINVNVKVTIKNSAMMSKPLKVGE